MHDAMFDTPTHIERNTVSILGPLDNFERAVNVSVNSSMNRVSFTVEAKHTHRKLHTFKTLRHSFGAIMNPILNICLLKYVQK